MDWQYIVGIIIFIILAVLATRGIILSKTLKESGELLTVIGQALEDGTITSEEVSQILKEANDVKAAFLGMVTLIKSKR